MLLVTGPVSAQFACTTTPADVTCTNTGNSGTFTNTATGANQNATTTNTGSVSGGQFGGAIQTITTSGGNATAVNSGDVAMFVNAITQAGGNATFTNSGDFVFGRVQTQAGGNATFTNSGNIVDFVLVDTLAGGNASGTNSGTVGGTLNVGAVNGNASASNSGSVGGTFGAGTTSGSATASNSGIVVRDFGASARNGNATATNSGAVGRFLVSTADLLAPMGVVAGTGGNATGTNMGSVNQLFLVVAFEDGNASGSNSGTVGQMMEVIAAGGGNVTATNSGIINGGVELDAFKLPDTFPPPPGSGGGGSMTLTNSGAIRNTLGGPAILFFGDGPDTLNLLAGSTIIGSINLAGTKDTVNFISGNHNLTFDSLAHATVTGPIVAVSGNRAAAVDPTPFAHADTTLMDFTRGISGILGSLGGTAPAPSGPLSSAFAADDRPAARVDDVFSSIPALAYADGAAVFKNPTMVASDGRSAWARGFGGEHLQDADGPLLRTTTTFMGGAAGFDLLARPDLRLGVFAGGGQSRMSIDANVGRVDTDTAFGGLYGRYAFASFGLPSVLDFSLHGGGSTSAASRNINNNTLPAGHEAATAHEHSRYLGPELAYAVNVPLGREYTLTPSVGVRYVAGFFDGYTESGSTANLTVANRTIQDVEERGELMLTRATPIGSDLLVASVHVGALGLERIGDTTVNAVLLGAGLPFVTPGRNVVAGVLGGGGLEWRAREGVSFFGAAEAIGMSDSSRVASARGGIRVAF